MEHNGPSLTTELTKYLEGLGFDIHQQNDYFGDIAGAIFEDPRAESKIVHTSLPGDHQLQNHRVNEDFSRARMKIYRETTYFIKNDREIFLHYLPKLRDGQETLTGPDKEHTDLPNGESDQVKELGFIFSLEIKYSKGLVHEVTDMCGDACTCIPKRKTNKKEMEEEVFCLLTCQVKVLSISGYRGTCGELKQMRHFLGNLKCLETVKVGVEVTPGEDKNGNNMYMGIINALMKLLRASSNCQIHVL